MSVNLTVPALGESVTEASVAQWFVKEGDHVAKDQPLCEFESDKVNVEISAPVGGVLAKILKKPGETVSVGETVGVLEPGEGFAGERAPGAAVGVRSHEIPPTAGAHVGEASNTGGPTTAPPAGSASAGSASAGSAPTGAAAGVPHPQPLSPAVRRLVAENELDTANVAGTGLGGRLTKGDVLGVLQQRGSSAPPAGQSGSPAASVAPPAAAQGVAVQPAVQSAVKAPAAGGRVAGDESRIERVKMSSLRRKVAERLVQVQQTAAILTTFNECDMSGIMELRSRYQDRFKERYGIKLGFMSFFVKACIDALKQYPGVNAEINGDEILYKHYYDIGVAVGGGRGLVVPVVRDADRLSFAELEKTIAELGTKARDNKLSPDDLSGGTFTISNGGIYGSMMSTPILNAPQTGILGMHNIIERPIAVNGQVVIRPMMYLALSYDHRVIDGREAVSFLVRVKECIERPERMLVEV